MNGKSIIKVIKWEKAKGVQIFILEIQHALFVTKLASHDDAL